MKNSDTNPDLYNLSRPVPKKFIKPAPVGKFGTFVPHYVVTQILLANVGPFDWELVQILRGDSTGKIKGREVTVTNVIVGAVYRLTCIIDGSRVQIEEVGELDAYTKSNDGARLKHASSDALKRAAMRLGVAIQLWCKTGDEHFLPEFLRDEASREEVVDVVEVGGEELDDAPDLPDDDAPLTEIEEKYALSQDAINTASAHAAGAITFGEAQDTDNWNLLLATLEVLPTSKDTVEAWRAYAKQMTDLMVRTGCWKEPAEDKLKGLLKDELVEKVTAAHAAAQRKAAENAPF